MCGVIVGVSELEELPELEPEELSESEELPELEPEELSELEESFSHTAYKVTSVLSPNRACNSFLVICLPSVIYVTLPFSSATVLQPLKTLPSCVGVPLSEEIDSEVASSSILLGDVIAFESVVEPSSKVPPFVSKFKATSVASADESPLPLPLPLFLLIKATALTPEFISPKKPTKK